MAVSNRAGKSCSNREDQDWIPDPYTRLMANYTVTDFDTPIVVNGIGMDQEKALTLRAQIDF